MKYSQAYALTTMSQAREHFGARRVAHGCFDVFALTTEDRDFQTVALLPAMKSSKSTYFKLNLQWLTLMDAAIKEDGVFVSAAKMWNSITRKVNNEVLHF